MRLQWASSFSHYPTNISSLGHVFNNIFDGIAFILEVFCPGVESFEIWLQFFFQFISIFYLSDSVTVFKWFSIWSETFDCLNFFHAQ